VRELTLLERESTTEHMQVAGGNACCQQTLLPRSALDPHHEVASLITCKVIGNETTRDVRERWALSDLSIGIDADHGRFGLDMRHLTGLCA
jgi:hypothetical protein